MTSIERTAYPRFKRLITAHELHLFFAPTREEAAWAAERMDSDGHQLALLLALNSYQRMGRFPKPDEYPEMVVDFVRRTVELPEGTLPLYETGRTAERQRTEVRQRVGTKYQQSQARQIAEAAIRKEAAAKNRPADLINIALFTHFIPCGVWEAVYIIEGLLKNTSEVKPTTVHADTQGQSVPVFALAHLLGFDLMPRIRNWKGLTFYRPSKQSEYVHIDSLFGEPGKNVIDWDLIESQFRHLMKVAVSVREGAISSSTLLKRLRSGSHKNSTYTAFREVGRVIRTVQLLRYLSDAPLRRRVTAATNKVESFNRFSQWVGFGNQGVLADNDPIEQEKAMKFNALLTSAVIFHNALDIAEIIRQLLEEGWEIDPEDLAHISPYLTEHIKRFGEYSTQELGIQPEAYDPKLDVDFTLLRDQDPAASGFSTAA
ncbi:Tn3 family transposase [Kitasatospora sp. NPDC087271]|uniref:Tn3 family transposase n=1 Tax=Kitasatospora sp. NPDC087271 TaxID=3364067 RepID=UPI003816B420